MLTSVDAGAIPWSVLVLNIVGSVLLGVLLAEQSSQPSAELLLRDGGATGFCGGLTTFSSFSLELVELTRHGEVAAAAIYGSFSVVGAIVGVLAGGAMSRRARPRSLPLEDRR